MLAFTVLVHQPHFLGRIAAFLRYLELAVLGTFDYRYPCTWTPGNIRSCPESALKGNARLDHCHVGDESAQSNSVDASQGSLLRKMCMPVWE